MSVPTVAIIFNFTSAAIFSRSTCLPTLVREPSRVSCLLELVMANLRPFIGVFWFFKEFRSYSVIMCLSFGVPSVSDLISLLDCFVRTFMRCERYLGSDLGKWHNSALFEARDLVNLLLVQGSQIFFEFTRGSFLFLYPELVYFFLVLDYREWQLVLGFVRRGRKGVDKYRAGKGRSKLVGYYSREVIKSDVEVLYRIWVELGPVRSILDSLHTIYLD